MRKTIALMALLLFRAASTRAEVKIDALRWQQASREKEQAAQSTDVSRLPLPAGQPLQGRLRVLAKLLNRGPAVEGVLLRYSLTAKIAPDDGSQAAVWSVPFSIDEKRVPKIGANQYLEVSLDPTNALSLYLNRVRREGYWPSELKLQLMVAPRKGQSPLQLLESTLPVVP